jgi:predicted phage tail protein
MVNVHLTGPLANEFGTKPIKLAVHTPQMMFRGLECAMPEFPRTLREMGGRLSIVCVADDIKKAYSIKEEFLHVPFGKVKDVYLVHDVEGAGIETALVAFFVEMGASAAVAATLATISINLAVSVVLGVVAQALAPSPDTSGNGNEKPEERGSLIFNGAVNTEAQGGALPVVYGQCLTGSVVISAGVTDEEIPV